MSIKDKSCNSREGLQLYQKEALIHFPVHIQKVLGIAFFYRTTPVSTFEVSFSTRKQFFKKEN